MAFSVSRAHSRILIFLCVWGRAWWGYILGYVSFALFNLYLCFFLYPNLKHFSTITWGLVTLGVCQ